MISKKSPPPRPPLPSRRKAEPATGQQLDEANAQKKFGLFSIRYSRDDANESDEEISIVRKDSLPDGESESTSAEVKSENARDVQNGHSPSSGTSSVLSALTLPFLPKSSTVTSGSEALSCDEPSKQDTTNNSEGEFVFKTSHFEEEHMSNPGSLNEVSKSTSNDRHSTSPPTQKRKENPVMSSAMSLSSLLKKEFEQKTNLGKGSSPDEPKKTWEVSKESPQTKGFIASALAGSSQLLMPIGLGDLSGASNHPVEEKEDKTYTDVPLYNLLLVAMVVFLYFMLPSSSFVNGFVFGGNLTFFLVFALMWLLTPEMSDEERYKRDILEHEREMKMLQKKVSCEYLQRWQLNQQPDLEVSYSV